MKCFHFSKENNDDEDNIISPKHGPGLGSSIRGSKVSWARSLSIASSTSGGGGDVSLSTQKRRCEEELNETVGFHEMLSMRRSNELRVFGYGELKVATRGFSRGLMIGEGGFGCVYKGVVDNGKLDVAVKQLNRNGMQGHKEWITEVNLLGVVKHPNLVKLVGYCAEDDERGIQRLLVYELMPNKSLEDHLIVRVQSPLPWIMRLKIANDAARGLSYLHEEMDFQLIFRDFKTSNVLLDEGFNAKLSDFGLARQGPSEGLGHVSTSVVGTVGYAAPEYVQTGRLTAKSDVWSFGVVLYELITGRRSVDKNLPKSEQKLLEWVKPFVSGSKKIHLIMDPRLEGQYSSKSAEKLVSLANKCLMKQPKSRPKMSEVVEYLGQIIAEIEPIDDVVLELDKEDEVVKDDEAVKGDVVKLEDMESTKQRNNYFKKVFDMRDLASLRNKSIRKLDWRNWTPVRT